MARDTDRYKLFTRRTALLAGGKLLLFSALAGRLYYLQVIEADRYATLADENRISLRLLPPPRGPIVDRRGEPLAVNKQNYRAVLVAENSGDVEGTLAVLSAIIPLGEHDKRRILREIKRKRSFVPVTLRENLSWEDVARIEVNAPDLPGVTIDVGETRDYLHGAETAHVLGYVAVVSEREAAAGDPLLELPGFRIGKDGVEKVQDRALRGTGGSLQVEVNAVGRVIRELSRQEGQPGAEVRLTIDLELQRLAAAALGEESGSAVVMDAHTGAISAIVSTPSFDPNAFSKGLSAEQWRSLASSAKAPLINKAIAGQYAPGSTFKLAVALAALDRGIITPKTTFFCPGFLRLGDSLFHCWKKTGHGTMDLHNGITQSCDVYFYEVAKRTGIDRIAAMARRLGIGRAHGLDLPGESTGLMPTREWKRAATGVPWQQGESLIAGIGQGFILATPLQLAMMTAAIVNGGHAVTPHVVADVGAGGATPYRAAERESLGLQPAHLAWIREAMDAVSNSPRGTAFRARIKEPGFEMGGKTGTSQVRRITKAERETGIRKNEDLPWRERDHALFVGFAPVGDPRFVASVVVEHGGGGSAVAAPIARDILLAAQRRALEPSDDRRRLIGSLEGERQG